MIPETIRRHAREKGGETAYWTPGRTWTFAQLEDAARRIAQGFRSLGIGAGDRVRGCKTGTQAALWKILHPFCTFRQIERTRHRGGRMQTPAG